MKNNWYPGMSLDVGRSLHTERLARARGERAQSVSRILADAALAWRCRRRSIDRVPTVRCSTCSRSTCAPTAARTRRTGKQRASAETVHAGAQQLAWLKRALRSSTATWKVIASDLPIGLVVRDGATAFEAIANGDGGPPLGRELEIADLLRFMQHGAHSERRLGDRRRALCRRASLRSAARALQGFRSVLGVRGRPAARGHRRPVELDSTFGPEERFNAAPRGLKRPPGPPQDCSFSGRLRIAAKTRVMTVSLQNLAGGHTDLYRMDLDRH